MNVLYTEIVAIITRASIISFWLTGLVANGVMNNSIGMVKNFWIKYFIIVIISIFFSLFVNGKINIYKISNESNSIISDKFYLDSLSIIFLILKGNKINNIRRNIVFFPGSKESKNITITNDGLILCIENTYPPKTKDITVTFIILIFTLICLFCASGISLLIFHYTKSILDTYNINVNSSNLLKDFYLIILSYYLLPFVIPNKDAKKSIIRYFSINLGLYNGYQVLTSPLIPYIGNFENNYIGLADPQKRIFVNPNFIRNKTIFQYIVAHEVGHLTDKIYHTLKYILSPILFPYLTFIIFVMKEFDVKIKNLLNILGFLTIGFVIISWLKLEKESENRADDIAVKIIGYKAVIDGMRELLNYLHFDVKIEERYKRMKEKCPKK